MSPSESTTVDVGLDELRALSRIIQTSIDKLEASLTARGEKFPSPNEPYTQESEAGRNAPDALSAVNNIVAAAGPLIAVASPPGQSLGNLAIQVCGVLRVLVVLALMVDDSSISLRL